jgi:hypothetical protein
MIPGFSIVLMQIERLNKNGFTIEQGLNPNTPSMSKKNYNTS